MNLLLKGSSVVDTDNSSVEQLDILTDGKIIKCVGKNISAPPDAEVFDLSGMYTLPALLDIHVHLREPGFEYKETIASGLTAAIRGGFTAVACMPNTQPPIDNKSVAEFVKDKARMAGQASLYIIGCISKNREGKELAEIGEMVESGVVGISDDGNPVMNSLLMRRAMEYSKIFNIPVVSHCEDLLLCGNGVMNEGFIATTLGLKGIPAAAEEIMIQRDIALTELTGAHLHITHISTKNAVELIREAKKKGIKVTCDVTPHHLVLTEEAVMDTGYDTNAKVNPPLRTKEDVEYLIEGLKDGTIDAIASDHAPHALHEKETAFDLAAFGVIGLEATLPVLLTKIVNEKHLTLQELVKKLSSNPHKILGLPLPFIKKGEVADLTIVDLNKNWKIDSNNFASLSRNTPFNNFEAEGAVVMTIKGGEVLYKETSYV